MRLIGRRSPDEMDERVPIGANKVKTDTLRSEMLSQVAVIGGAGNPRKRDNCTARGRTAM